jgi:DNA-binding Lrp family transcriptional regulator
MKLTRRQEEFVINLHELSNELDGPIHYSLLAERLGVSPFTAYDMLCLLEEKGLAKSVYQLASDKIGPGRAERVFTPTSEALARQMQAVHNPGKSDHKKGAQVKVVLDRTGYESLPDREFVEETLAHIPPEIEEDDLRFCMEVMIVIALLLRGNTGKQTVAEFWREIAPDNSTVNSNHLSALAGFSYRIAAQECTSDPKWLNKILENINHFIEITSGMELIKIIQLSDYVRELFPTENKTRSKNEFV